MKFDEVIAFFELFIKFIRQRGKEGVVGDQVDKKMLVDFANDKFFIDKISKLSLFQIACMYWTYSGVGVWNSQIIEKLEAKLVYFVENEIQTQKQLEKAKDDRTDDKLQSITLNDLKTIMTVYETDPTL